MFKPKKNTEPMEGQLAPRMFGGFGGAKARTQDAFIAPGVYVLEILRHEARIGDGPKSKGKELFFARFVVREVITAFESDADFPASQRVGENVLWMQKEHADYPDMHIENMKGHFLAIARIDDPSIVENDISAEEWDAALQEAVEPPGTAHAGKLLIASASKIMTKGPPSRPITVVSFAPYVAPEPA